MSVTRSVVLGCGSYLPAKVVSNDDLAKMVDTTDEWIVERTGIKRRHMAAEGEVTSDLAFAAASDAIKTAGISAKDIDLIIVATTTPDKTFPSVATKLQAKLGMVKGAAFDIQAVCSGFIYGLSIADNFIRGGEAKTVLLVGAETMTRLIDCTDRGTCVLFGDGAGAAILQAAPGKGTIADRGVLNAKIFSDGRQNDLIYVDGGPSSTGTTGRLHMHGREVFKHAVANITHAVEVSMATAEVKTSDIDWFVPHQANQRILDGAAKKLGISSDKVVSTIAEHGNTSAASVPLALVTAVKDGRIQRGDLVLLEAMGAGFTWGAALIRW
jgi:3-oxoacyl-[acyl-carrier-protein] synthase III